FIADALDRGSHFVCFPECVLSGYESPEAIQAGARSLDDPELRDFIAETASHDMVVLIGTARLADDGLYNSQLVLHRGELLGLYDKVCLTGPDAGRLGFTPGRSVPVFEAHGVRFAVQICHDSSFPYVAMAAKRQGAEVLFSPHNNEIGAAHADDHRTWVRNCHIGLACQMKMVVARANIVKSDRPGMIGYGDSFILSPQGVPLAEAGLHRAALITATITPELFGTPHVWADMDEAPEWVRLVWADSRCAVGPRATGHDGRPVVERLSYVIGRCASGGGDVTRMDLGEVIKADYERTGRL
ncbi:MAG: carbon-nitrogen hydrolase family protein, partial [Armatimonadetes bacterium]|nr:carbon-nitrogen hydrolase family protein [Armatimonadota bacterium]